MIKLEAVSERDEVSGLGTLQEDILPQAINLITFQTPNSTALSTVVLSSSRHDDNSAAVVKDVLGCPVVESRYAGCKCHSFKTTGNLTEEITNSSFSFRFCRFPRNRFLSTVVAGFAPGRHFLCNLTIFAHRAIWPQICFGRESEQPGDPTLRRNLGWSGG